MTEPKIPQTLRAKIEGLPPLKQAEMMLTQPDLGLPPATPVEACMSSMAWRIFQMARRGGILGGRPAYEARETFAHRVRSVITRSVSFDEWAISLSRACGVEFSSLALLDRIHWRQALMSLTPTDWRRFSRNAIAIENVITSAALLSELMTATGGPCSVA